ncbi:MAG: hypothetical protein JWN27_1316 [Candidatus Eremiobacteraeota bacterium]|nr:hypothetical protein [Candidatus Eremiobacteraeota bacterium]
MHISWEALSASGSAISSIAVLAAVIVAARQVRVGAQQVEHLRKATQLDGTMKIFEKLASPEQQEARRFVAMALAAKLEDPDYRAELGLMTMAPQPHPEMTVLRLMEMVGTYVKHGLLDQEIIFDYWIPAIVNTWEPLQRLGVIKAHRDSGGTKMWENFEVLYERGQGWLSTADPYDFLPMGRVR